MKQSRRDREKSEEIKKEYAKTIKYSKIVAFLFFVVLTPTIIMTVRSDILYVYGLDRETWFNISLVGFLVYLGFVYFYWKCPKCKEFPGRGWFRKNCEKCGVELT